MPTDRNHLRGRGALDNPRNRFERIDYQLEVDDQECGEERPKPQTQFFKDLSRSIISHNNSPDVGFDVSINPYRGCEHGCAYCYARPTHEYLGWSAGLDFETKILVKTGAPALLRAKLSDKRWRPQMLALSGVTDPYQPVERKLRLTRGCLEVLAEFRHPVCVVTKNHLVTRDADLLADLAGHRAAYVCVSITTLDGDLTRVLEPRTSHPQRRLAAIETLARAGVPVGVLIAPVIPGLNDHEIPAVLTAAAAAGAHFAGFVMLRLPHGVAGIFEGWLDAHLPQRKKKVLDRLRQMRGGKLTESQFFRRMRGRGPFADQIRALFNVSREKAGLARRLPELSTTAFRRPDDQATLF